MYSNAHAEWLSLLPYMDEEELRELLGEGGAARLSEGLVASGLSSRWRRLAPSDPGGCTLVADVLTELYGHPNRFLA